ncbi:MAG: hypothetical protein ACW99G_13215 [Candidatus Thorarchaeota archaeon]|jgi:hypothetical protein
MMTVASGVPKLSQRKWIYEEIVEKIPPFRWLPPTWDVIAQAVLVEGLGILAFIYFNMPVEYSHLVRRLSLYHTFNA